MTRGTNWYLKTKLPLLLLHCLLSDPNFIQSINFVNTPWTLLPAPLTSQPQCVCKMGSFYMLQNGCCGQPQASWHSLEISYPPLPISPETSPSFCWGRVAWLALLFWRNLAANCLNWFLSSRAQLQGLCVGEPLLFCKRRCWIKTDSLCSLQWVASYLLGVVSYWHFPVQCVN